MSKMGLTCQREYNNNVKTNKQTVCKHQAKRHYCEAYEFPQTKYECPPSDGEGVFVSIYTSLQWWESSQTNGAGCDNSQTELLPVMGCVSRENLFGYVVVDGESP